MPKIIGKPNQTNFLSGTDGRDVIKGNNQIDFISGGGGNDYIYGGPGNDFLNGGMGNDFLRGGRGDDRLFGGAGNDRLFGDQGNDVLQGEEGNDKLYMSDGDIGNGGSGADQFIWQITENQTISISDFDALEGDQMLLAGTDGLQWEALEATNHTVVAFENGAEVKFFGYTAAEIEANSAEFGL